MRTFQSTHLIKQVDGIDVVLVNDKFEKLGTGFDKDGLELSRLPVGAFVRIQGQVAGTSTQLIRQASST